MTPGRASIEGTDAPTRPGTRSGSARPQYSDRKTNPASGLRQGGFVHDCSGRFSSATAHSTAPTTTASPSNTRA